MDRGVGESRGTYTGPAPALPKPRPCPSLNRTALHPLALLLALWTLGAAAFAGAPADDPVHLFVLSGQSNMAGLDPDERFTPAVEAAFGAERVVVVKDAQDGQPIRRWYKQWRDADGEAPESTGDLYDRLMTKVRPAIEGKTLASVTLVWMQGERDARGADGDVYEQSLRGLVQQLSADLGRDDVNCVVGRLSDFDLANERYRHWTRVRAAQVAFAESSPRFAWVDTDDLNDGVNRKGEAIENDSHYSVEGYRKLGERFAREAIALVRGVARPHVVLVMADDQGWGDTGYNGHPFVQTPTLDAMAAEGFVFDRFHAAAPVCSPTRASVLTGRTPVRTKVTNHGRYMRPEERTIAETLKAAGYVTGLVGKFHLGSAQPDSPCNPTAMGFDEWCIGLNFFDDDPYLSRNGVVEPREGRGSALVVDEAVAFLERHAGGDAPLFLVVWFPSPHDPHEELPDGPALYEGEEAAGYYREITLLDQQLGRLRRELRRLGLADDTLLWYCSDNGGLVEATSGGRAKKGSVYQGGLRVPAIVEWPARGLRGRSAMPACTSDLYPTLLELIGLPLEAPHPLDGVDVSGAFWGATTRSRPMGVWHHFQRGQATWSDRILEAIHEKQQAGAPTPHDPERIAKDVAEVPQFDEAYARGHAAWTDWPWKLHRIDGPGWELYDLDSDPMEARDLAGEPEHAERVERMQGELRAWMRGVVRSVNGGDY